MKTEGITQLINKTITGVVVKRRNVDRPGLASQVFLVFSDDTCYEIYTLGEDIQLTNGPEPGGIKKAREYMSDSMETIFEVFQDGEGKLTTTK